MTAKPDDSSPHTGQGRREFLRTGSIIAGGMLLSRTGRAHRRKQPTGIPLSTLAKDFPFLTPARDKHDDAGSPSAHQRGLDHLVMRPSNREELDAELALDFTANDLNSLEQAFANYGVGRFEAVQIEWTPLAAVAPVRRVPVVVHPLWLSRCACSRMVCRYAAHPSANRQGKFEPVYKPL